MGDMGNGVQGYGAHVQLGTGGMDPIDNGAHGQWGTGVWITWAMGYRGMGPMDNGRHGQWGRGVWGTWAMGYMDMGHMFNGVQGYGSHGQWGTWIWGTWAMGYRPSNVSECQKDVKCQKIKHLDYGGGSQKKRNWHSEVHTY